MAAAAHQQQRRDNSSVAAFPTPPASLPPTPHSPCFFAQVMTGRSHQHVGPTIDNHRWRSSDRHGTSLAAEICSRWKNVIHCSPIMGEDFSPASKNEIFLWMSR